MGRMMMNLKCIHNLRGKVILTFYVMVQFWEVMKRRFLFIRYYGIIRQQKENQRNI